MKAVDMKMQELKETFAERLKAARKMRDMTMDQLAKLTGGVVSKSNLSKYENGKMMPSAATHIALAKALQLDFDYFFRPFTVELGKADYRKLSKLTKHEEEKIWNYVRDVAERYAELESLTSQSIAFDNPACDIEVKTTDDAVNVAGRLRKEWGLGNGVLLNVVNILEEHGIKVVEVDASDAFDGMHTPINGKVPMIVLNRHYTIERKRFSAMHELGHVVLNLDPSLEHKVIENLCNDFASEMLLPRNILKKCMPYGITLKYVAILKDIQTQFGISVDAIWFKLKQLGLVNEVEYGKYYKRKNARHDFKQFVMESSYHGDERTYRFERLLKEAVIKGAMTEEKANEIFHTININLNNDTNANIDN